MLVTGAWKTTSFKEYNFSVPAEDIDGGQLHPLLKVRQEFREIFMELGFQEMDTQHWVESSFWNFDSLFIPQQHPARDLQDTFFISKPATSEVVQKELMAKVRAAHEAAFRTPWKEEEAKRNILRTHTTGSSAYTLFRLAQMSEKLPDGTLKFRPGRYYSIDRVFRNEEMDKTHLCEFHQIEGFVVGRNISLANMMHTFDKFFRRIGIERLRFKPTFNPYTEPSMEIFGFHTGLKKWIEVGNSGLFRPELLGPLGFDAGVSVMAWGISLERNTMIKYNISNIHELFGHRVNINFIKRSAIARF
ncbi:phenylalanyl-tRNA synthetase alpha chain [Angomonas deanei]|nr:phenylalanyl-tRNA synthetase alpha chain [Angomonas deanei]|eukprot:EPY26011.1 phenylalanyl-tRNA synthetase alpha chain [Angomonas deanei]